MTQPPPPYIIHRMSSECQMRWNCMPHQRVSEVPSISITPTRRVSVSSPLRFTRTFSEDSLDSIERTGRKELRRQRIMQSSEESERPVKTLLPSPSMCPHLGEMGRSRTESLELADFAKTPLSAKRSTGDLTRDIPSPTKRTLADFLGLTPYQQRLISQCWPNIYATGPNGQFASSIYSNLSNKNAKARQLLAKANGVAVFANSDIDCTVMHARATAEIVDQAVRGLDSDHQRLTAYIVEIGKAHRHLRAEGLGTTVWDELGDSIIDCLRRYDSVRKHKELRRAWLAITAYIVDNLKQGQTLLRASSSYDIADRPVSPSKKNSSA